jgi:hypothetical protein
MLGKGKHVGRNYLECTGIEIGVGIPPIFTVEVVDMMIT